MPDIAVAVTKDIDWRGHREAFSNVYHYNSPLVAGEAVGLTALADALVELERPIHSSAVQFKQVRIWSVGGTAQENETLLIRDYGTTPGLASGTLMNAENVYLVEFPTARPSLTGRPVTLKKFIHSGVLLGGDTVSVANGLAQIGSGARSALGTYASGVRTINAGNTTHGLVSPTDRVPNGQYVFNWIEHREFT